MVQRVFQIEFGDLTVGLEDIIGLEDIVGLEITDDLVWRLLPCPDVIG